MISIAFFIIALFIIYVSNKDLDRGFILFLCFRLILNYTIGISFIPGLPNIQLEMLMCIYFIYMYCMKYTRFIPSNPLFKSINVLILSFAISSVFTEANFVLEVFRLFNNLVRGYVFILPLWLFVCVFKERDKLFFAGCIYTSVLIVILYSLICIQLGENPLVQSEFALVGGDFSESGYMKESSLRGVRWSSIFLHPIGCGANCVYLLGLVFFLQHYLNIDNRIKVLILIVIIIGLLFVILQTKSRTPIIGFALLLLPSILQTKRLDVFLLIFLIMGVGLFLLDETSLALIGSFTQNNVEEVGGSDADMRVNQLLGTLYFMQYHPIFGYGSMGYDDILYNTKFELFGIESIWFITGLSYGIVGIFALSYLYFSMFNIKIKNHKFDIIAIAAAYVLMNTVSSIPDQKEFLPFLLIFLYIREERRAESLLICKNQLIRFLIILKLMIAKKTLKVNSIHIL